MNYYIPQWEERTSYGFRRIDPYGKLFEERIIFLGTPISDDTANVVIPAALPAVRGTRARHQHVHQLARRLVHRGRRSTTRCSSSSPTPDRLHGPRRLRCRGLLAAGTPGATGLPNCRMMIHQPYSQGSAARARTSRSRPTRSCGCASCSRSSISDHTGKTPEEVNTDIERDKILTSQAAVEYGLIDGDPGVAQGHSRFDLTDRVQQSGRSAVSCPIRGRTYFSRSRT